MAVPHARGAIRVGDSMVHKSIIGSRFTGRIVGTATVAGRPAILPTREGRAGTQGLGPRVYPAEAVRIDRCDDA